MPTACYQGARRAATILLTLTIILFTSIRSATAWNDDEPIVRSWRADHHMHLSSPDLCARLRNSSDEGCLESNHPAAVYAADAVKSLDEAHVSNGVILSSAYLYGLASLKLSS